MKDEFISIASHELNTPLAAIQGYLSMILDEKLVKVDDQAANWLSKVYDSAKRLTALVRDLLSVSRIEQGRMKLEKEVFDMCEQIELAVGEFASMAREKGLEVNFEKPAACPRVKADKMKIREVLANLISNAIKYTPQGNVSVSLRMSKVKGQMSNDKTPSPQPSPQSGAGEGEERLPRSARNDKESVEVGPFGESKNFPRTGLRGTQGRTSENKMLEVTVADTGMGMSQEQIEHLFTKFYRAERAETKSIQGTGLGLYITKKIVELHDGKIWVESTYGKGSRFIFTLPME